MNALTSHSPKPLRPQMTCDIRRPLFTLFSAYPVFNSTPQADDARLESYRLGLQGLPEWVVMEAVTRFVQGKVDRKSRDRLPTAEQVAAVSREILNDQADKEKAARLLEQQRREREAERAVNKPPAAERERIAERVRQAIRTVGE